MPQYEPTGRARFFGFPKEVTKETLGEFVSTLAKDTTHCDGGYFYHTVPAAMCEVYNADAPWTWLIQRVMKRYSRVDFLDPAWVNSFAVGVFETINKAEQVCVDELSLTIGVK